MKMSNESYNQLSDMVCSTMSTVNVDKLDQWFNKPAVKSKVTALIWLPLTKETDHFICDLYRKEKLSDNHIETALKNIFKKNYPILLTRAENIDNWRKKND